MIKRIFMAVLMALLLLAPVASIEAGGILEKKHVATIDLSLSQATWTEAYRINTKGLVDYAFIYIVLDGPGTCTTGLEVEVWGQWDGTGIQTVKPMSLIEANTGTVFDTWTKAAADSTIMTPFWANVIQLHDTRVLPPYMSIMFQEDCATGTATISVYVVRR